MARLKAVSPELLCEVARQIGDFFEPSPRTGLFGAAPGESSAPWSLKEHLPIRKLEESKLKYAVKAGLDIRDAAPETDKWQYQMALDNKPRGFAQAEIDAQGNPHVQSVSETDEARHLESVLQIADRDLPDFQGEAALVDALDHGVRALVLVADDLEKPSLVFPYRIPPETKYLKLGNQYSSSEFLAAISDMPTLEGVMFDDTSLQRSD